MPIFILSVVLLCTQEHNMTDQAWQQLEAEGGQRTLSGSSSELQVRDGGALRAAFLWPRVTVCSPQLCVQPSSFLRCHCVWSSVNTVKPSHCDKIRDLASDYWRLVLCFHVKSNVPWKISSWLLFFFKKMTVCWDGSPGKGTCHQTWWPELEVGTHREKAVNQLLQAALWPLHVRPIHNKRIM